MDNKEITFAGSVVGEPWWTLGEIVAEVLKQYGYKVNITTETAGANNIRWVAGRKADVGPMQDILLQAALRGREEYEGEVYKDLVSIATIQWPSWLGLAVRRETGVTSLTDAREKKYPLRIFAPSREKGRILDTILRHHGMTMEEIESWGGQFTKWQRKTAGEYWREGRGDLILGQIYLGYSAKTSYWHEATMLHDMRFLDFDEALIEKLVNVHGYSRALMPHGLYRGVDRDIPCVGMDKMYIYCLKDQSADLVRCIAEGLDKNADLVKNTRSFLYYDREKVALNPHIPLHPTAEEYYRMKGYIT